MRDGARLGEVLVWETDGRLLHKAFILGLALVLSLFIALSGIGWRLTGASGGGVQ